LCAFESFDVDQEDEKFILSERSETKGVFPGPPKHEVRRRLLGTIRSRRKAALLMVSQEVRASTERSEVSSPGHHSIRRYAPHSWSSPLRGLGHFDVAESNESE